MKKSVLLIMTLAIVLLCAFGYADTMVKHKVADSDLIVSVPEGWVYLP